MEPCETFLNDQTDVFSWNHTRRVIIFQAVNNTLHLIYNTDTVHCWVSITGLDTVGSWILFDGGHFCQYRVS